MMRNRWNTSTAKYNEGKSKSPKKLFNNFYTTEHIFSSYRYKISRRDAPTHAPRNTHTHAHTHAHTHTYIYIIHLSLIHI